MCCCLVLDKGSCVLDHYMPSFRWPLSAPYLQGRGISFISVTSLSLKQQRLRQRLESAGKTGWFSTFLTPHSMLMAAVSLCFRSPSQPWGVHREPCFTHTQEQSQTMWGKRPAYSLETLHWAELWCFNLSLTYKDTNEHERRQLGQRSEHQLCRKDSRGWGEPTERITGRDTKTMRVWITEASEWERFWGSGRLPDSHPQEVLLSSKIPPRGFMPQGHL